MSMNKVVVEEDMRSLKNLRAIKTKQFVRKLLR